MILKKYVKVLILKLKINYAYIKSLIKPRKRDLLLKS